MGISPRLSRRQVFVAGIACGAAAAALLGTTAAASSAPKPRAHDPIYMQYGPLNSGSVQNTGKQGSGSWIEINSFQWGVGRGVTAPVGGSATPGAGKVALHQVLINVRMNSRFSAILFQDYLHANRLPAMELTQGSVSGGTYSPFLRVLLKDAVVEAVSFNSDPATDGGLPTEQVTLGFAQVKLAFGKRPNMSTSTLGSPSATTASWSASANG